MGEYVIKLPDIGEGVTEAEVVEWMVKPGDVVREDDALVSVMTDKAAVELPSPVTGTVLVLGAQVGDMLAVGSELLRLEVSGAGNVEPTQSGQSPRPQGVKTPAPPTPEHNAPDKPIRPIAAAVQTSDADTEGGARPVPGSSGHRPAAHGAGPNDRQDSPARAAAPPAPSAHGAEHTPKQSPAPRASSAPGRPRAPYDARDLPERDVKTNPAKEFTTKPARDVPVAPESSSAGGGSVASRSLEIAARGDTARSADPDRPAPDSAQPTADAGRSRAQIAAKPDGERPVASPAVRYRARQAGLDLHQIKGTGPAGRITQADLDRTLAQTTTSAGVDQATDAAPAPARPIESGDPTVSPQTDAPPANEAIKLTGLRRVIAGRMQNAWARIPHISYVEEVDVTQLESLRQQLNTRYAQSRTRLTLLPFLMRAIASVIVDFPNINATYDGEQGVLTRSGELHIGIATQSDTGLLVPVVRNVQNLDLWSCAAAIESVSGAARAGKAQRETLSGSTITISSLGALGGIVSTPIINYPEVAIVGVNRIRTLPTYVDGVVLPRKMMNLSSSFDHRIVDGYDAASFIQAIRALLETPTLLFID